MDDEFFRRPILNSPYEYPTRYWELDVDGQPTQKKIESRRPAEFITPIPKPQKRKAAAAQQDLILDEGHGLSDEKQHYAQTTGFAPKRLIVLMSLQPAIPWRVGLHQSPPPLHRPESMLNRPAETVNHHLPGAGEFSIGDLGNFQPALTVKLSGPPSPAEPAPPAVPPGSIQLQLSRGRLRVEGAVDPASWRVILDCLLG